MASRSRTTFKKRQKELARMEKQRDKAAKRMQRKTMKLAGGLPDLDGESPEGSEIEGAETEAADTETGEPTTADAAAAATTNAETIQRQSAGAVIEYTRRVSYFCQIVP